MNLQSKLAQLAELQFKKWGSSESQKKALGETGDDLQAWERPVIAVSREPGCGGGLIAQMLAKELGFDLFGIELVDIIANNARLSREMVATLDEKTQTELEDLLAEGLSEEQFSSKNYYRNLCTVVFAIGAHGNAVILGRGATFLLQPEDRLAVRLIAPLGMRVKKVMRKQNLSEEKSLEYFEEIRQQRRSFVKKHFNADIEDPANYDMVINTAFNKPKAIVKIIRAALDRKTP
jgi:cytidylate kinase